MSSQSPSPSTEIYIRFVTTLKDGTKEAGVLEAPVSSIQEAAGSFVDDDDCVSAFELTIDDVGCITSVLDRTNEVREHLINEVRYGSFDLEAPCPHPIIEDVFDGLVADAKEEIEAERDHERTESAMIHI